MIRTMVSIVIWLLMCFVVCQLQCAKIVLPPMAFLLLGYLGGLVVGGICFGKE